MQPLQAPVNASSKPDVIANLHQALQFLGQQLLPDEVRNRQYSDTTRRAVMLLQRALRLQEMDGFIGEQTAKRLNELLKEKGAFEEKELRLEVIVSEKPAGTFLADAIVEALGLNAAGAPVSITKAGTSANGIALLIFKEKEVRQFAELFFRVYQGNQQLTDTLNTSRWKPGSQSQVTIIVERKAEGKHRTVKGSVVTSEGLPLADKRVALFIKTIEGESLAASSTTGSSGSYTINYQSETTSDRPDLQVAVQEPTTTNLPKELGRSDVKYNAGEVETIDVMIATAAAGRATEFDRLTADVQPHLGRLQWSDVQEGDGKEQVTYLANKSGWDPRAIAMTAQASKLGAASGIPASHYYALFRAGADDDTMKKLAPQDVEAVLQKAAEQKMIPQDGRIQETVKALRAQNINHLLSSNYKSGVSDLNSVLSLRLNDAQKRTFLEAAQETAGDNGKMWTTLKERGFDEQTISRLQLDGKMGYLTNQNAPLIKRLYETHRISDPVELVRNGYYRPEQWMQVLGNDVPAGVAPAEYADHLSKQLRFSYPTAVTAEMVARDEVSLGNTEAKGEVVRFLSGNATKYDLGKQPLRRWEGFDAVSAEGKAQLKKLQRVYQITPSDQALSTLMKHNLTSAYDIVQYTEEEFVAKYGTEFANREEAILTYTKASEVESAVMNLTTTYLTYRAAPNVYSITGKMAKEETEIIANPTLEELFGNMDYCTCDHCKSVLSPAAYLVELLEFIDMSKVGHEKQNPVSVLFNRRPDLEHIQLSCENTNVALPYIDIVNEILEHYILKGSLEEFRPPNVDEHTTTADLLADPQFVTEAAYNEVKTKVYPYNLPFDYPLEALRLFFQQWDTPLADALRITGDAAKGRRELLGLNEEEYKILTGSTTRKLPEFFGELPAADMVQLNTAIANGKAFSRRTDIKYEELSRLLKTVFINPGVRLLPLLEKLQLDLVTLQSYYDGTLTDDELDAKLPKGIATRPYGGNIKKWLKESEVKIMGLIVLMDTGAEGAECNFADVQLRFALPDKTKNTLDAIAYHKLHRFIRLWKKLGWSIETTDKVVTTLMPPVRPTLTDTNINATFVTLLARIANFRWLLQKLGVNEKKIPDFILLWDSSRTIAFRQEQAAKLLKMRPEDYKELSAITGRDPLAADLQADYPSMLQFVDILQELKKISLKVPDLNFLLRHVDETGKLTPTEESLKKGIKALHDALTAIDKEHSMAPDNADFAFAKAKMALVYDVAVVNEFFGLLTNAKTVAAAFETEEEGLPAPVLSADANIGYDPFKKELTYRGILTTAGKSALAGVVDALVLDDMEAITSGAALDMYKTKLKAALQQLVVAGNEEQAAFGEAYPELKTIYDAVKAEADPAAQTAKLLQGILPELVARLKRTALQQTLGGLLKADAETVAVLTESRNVVAASGDNMKEVLADFLKLQEPQLFNGNSTFSFYLDAPATDDYLLYVKAPENTVVTMTVAGNNVIAGATVGTAGEVKNTAPLNLAIGQLYAVELTLASLPAGAKAELFWRTKGMAKTAVPASSVTIQQNVGHARTSLLRLQKAASLSRLLKLTPPELLYFASVNEGTKDILNLLDTDATVEPAALKALWEKLWRLVQFVGLRKDTEEEENIWLQVLQNPAALNPQGKSILLGMLYWQQADLDKVLEKFGLTLADLSGLDNLQKVVAAMNLVITVNYPAASVLPWITANPTLTIIEQIKAGVRTASSDAAYLETAQAVNDPLRNKQRDALVSYILYHKKPSPEITTPDKLYEYYLIDVQMDACMKTSRIRMALSTVQLFIQRCLMNLEPDVAPSSIRAKQWVWMSRYRVWEANRKVYLYPENWLEPELRDNKSSLFRELEGELLQSDINEDSAELAFLNYLKKLDDIARLEIVGMYLEENEAKNKNDDILHVIGRTYGANRQYYYRRFDGDWSPWEKVTLNIEGEHVFPVIWRKRLFLFWLTILEKPVEVMRSRTPQGMGGEPWGDHSKVNVEVTMNWGEYYKGKWTSPKSGELTRPVAINNLYFFRPNALFFHVRKEKKEGSQEHLIFNLYYVHESVDRRFTITYTSKNAPPNIATGADAALADAVGVFNWNLYRSTINSDFNYNTLFVSGRDVSQRVMQPSKATSPSVIQKVLTKSSSMFNQFRLLILRHVIENQWEAPFFYEDEQNTFFVTQDEEVVRDVRIFDGYYDFGVVTKPKLELPKLVEEPIPGWPPKKGGFIDKGELVSNPWDMHKNLFDRNENFKRIVADPGAFSFGDGVFTPGGKVAGGMKNLPGQHG
jgi:hypothetical protein